jgi:hypothetical protein
MVPFITNHHPAARVHGSKQDAASRKATRSRSRTRHGADPSPPAQEEYDVAVKPIDSCLAALVGRSSNPSTQRTAGVGRKRSRIRRSPEERGRDDASRPLRRSLRKHEGRGLHKRGCGPPIVRLPAPQRHAMRLKYLWAGQVDDRKIPSALLYFSCRAAVPPRPSPATFAENTRSEGPE